VCSLWGCHTLGVSSPELRASDADRDRTIAELREHVAAGRLTLEEFSERVERAASARTLADLEALGRDLPAATTTTPARRKAKRIVAVAFGSVEQTGRWRLSRRCLTLVAFGNSDLDLRRAELDGPVVSITAVLFFGNVDVYVPEGVDVDLGGLTLGGHRREWGTELDATPATPLLRVRVFSLLGTADVWRVPSSWVGRTFREVIRGLRQGEHRELPAQETLTKR
jgi:hypothetical protein